MDLWVRRLVILVALTNAITGAGGCAAPPPPPPQPPPPAAEVKAPPTEEQKIYDDTISVCGELSERQVEIWKNITYTSRTWKELSVKADEGSRVARCEMGQLLQKHKASSRRCTQAMVDDLLSFCGAPELPAEE